MFLFISLISLKKTNVLCHNFVHFCLLHFIKGYLWHLTKKIHPIVPMLSCDKFDPDHWMSTPLISWLCLAFKICIFRLNWFVLAVALQLKIKIDHLVWNLLHFWIEKSKMWFVELPKLSEMFTSQINASGPSFAMMKPISIMLKHYISLTCKRQIRLNNCIE